MNLNYWIFIVILHFNKGNNYHEQSDTRRFSYFTAHDI